MEQENKELKKENQELRRAGMQTEERCNLKMSEMRNALEMQVEEVLLKQKSRLLSKHRFSNYRS
jgi:hypothetical protein